jgi:subtilisin family serine protease
MPCNFSSGCTHGTHVAGTVAGNDGIGPDFGVARDSNIIAVQVFSRFDSANDCAPHPSPCTLTFTSDQIKGLERVYALRNTYSIASVNMSLGGGEYFDVASCDAANLAIKSAIDNLRSVGIVTLIASGNDGFTNSMGAPACVSSAISIGATDDFDEVASFSNISSFIDLVASGVSIRSSVPGGVLEEKNGTSMATPHVAGAWAVLKQANPNASIDSVLSALKTSATAVNDNRFGGQVNDLKRINVDTALTDFSVNQSITISNQGGSALTITSLTTNTQSPWITWSVTAPFSIPAGSSQSVIINVDFNNAPSGLSTSRLLIESNDSDESPYPGGININVNKATVVDVIFVGGFD